MIDNMHMYSQLGVSEKVYRFGEEVLASVPVIREEYGVAMRRFVSSVQEEGLSAQTDTLLATTSTPPGALLAGYLRRREAHLTC